jgi:hypothetical protein
MFVFSDCPLIHHREEGRTFGSKLDGRSDRHRGYAGSRCRTICRLAGSGNRTTTTPEVFKCNNN